MFTRLKVLFSRFYDTIFGSQKIIQLGIYGPPNSGKTTLANRICKDILNTDEEMGAVSPIAHETRKVTVKNRITISHAKKRMVFDLVDTPGIATRIDYEKFVRSGMNAKEAKQRAKEATRGVIESIKWLDRVDIVILVLDSTKNPYNQVNLTIIGNLEARKIPVIIVANKIDLKSSKLEKIATHYPNYHVVGISAKFARHMDEFYEAVLKARKQVKRH
ncbi:MAG: Era-like GTP-binding protein [Candidatus Woesearchaeota archaeon]